jgi:hypothetical protein
MIIFIGLAPLVSVVLRVSAQRRATLARAEPFAGDDAKGEGGLGVIARKTGAVSEPSLKI